MRAKAPVADAAATDVADHRPPCAVYILTKVVINPTAEFNRQGLCLLAFEQYLQYDLQE